MKYCIIKHKLCNIDKVKVVGWTNPEEASFIKTSDTTPLSKHSVQFLYLWFTGACISDVVVYHQLMLVQIGTAVKVFFIHKLTPTQQVCFKGFT